MSLWPLILLCLCAGCRLPSGQGELQHPASNAAVPDAVITVDDILSRSKTLATIVDVPFDPIYETTKKYQAIPLAALLNGFVRSQGTNSAVKEAVVLCRDGYKAFLPGIEALDGTGFLAFSDESAPGGTNISPVKTSSSLVDPGPFYLVWTNANPKARPWPYQIQTIEIYSKARPLLPAEPSGSALARKGFELFRKNCIACHSVNGAGGRVAVDLNIPMNVTEYWKEPVLRRLIVDASSVRANAKMPSFPGLTASNTDAIIGYLRDMRSRKVVTH